MFKEFGDGVRFRKLMKAINRVEIQLQAGRIDATNLKEAYQLCRNTTVPFSDLINLIKYWARMSMTMAACDQNDLSDECIGMSKFLQARLDAGEYY